VICGLGDLVGINNYGFEPVKLEVFEPSDATGELVERVAERWGTMISQDTESDLARVPVLASRELRRDPEYRPKFRPVPEVVSLGVELGAEEEHLVAGLLETGVYGANAGEALRAAFMRWCNLNLTRVRRPKLEFAGGPLLRLRRRPAVARCAGRQRLRRRASGFGRRACERSSPPVAPPSW
jgi:hypothetical protein